jgi:hypothetical protein
VKRVPRSRTQVCSTCYFRVRGLSDRYYGKWLHLTSTFTEQNYTPNLSLTEESNMSDRSQTTTNSPASEPRLCKMGCGFFVSLFFVRQFNPEWLWYGSLADCMGSTIVFFSLHMGRENQGGMMRIWQCIALVKQNPVIIDVLLIMSICGCCR